MRILDNQHATITRNVALYLKKKEAQTLLDQLAWILANPREHCHLGDDEQKREISVSIYDDDLLNSPRLLDRYNQLEQEMFREG